MLVQVFLNYGTTLPISASLAPSRTMTVANINSPNSTYGPVQVLAGANTSFGLRFTGVFSPIWHHCTQHHPLAEQSCPRMACNKQPR